MQLQRLCWFLAVSLCVCAPAAAGVYKWTDAQGKVHYSDKPPPDQATQEVNVPKAPPPPAPVARPPAPAPESALSYDERQALQREQEVAAQRKRVAEELEKQRREAQQPSKAMLEYQKQAIEKCKRDRETYCKDFESVKKGRQDDALRRQAAESRERSHRQAQCQRNGSCR